MVGNAVGVARRSTRALALPMALSPEIADLVLWELRFIRWLLILLVVILGLAALVVFSLMRVLGGAGKELAKQQETKKRQGELEELLSRGLPREAKFSALEWLSAQPKEPYAHWFLAKAHYQLDEWVEAKQAFETAVRIAPDWSQAVTPWLEKIDEHLENATPKLVK